MTHTEPQPQATTTVNAAKAPLGTRGHLPLGRQALIYTVGMLLSRAASLIMLPVYTRVLAPADYGLLQLLDMTSDAVAILVSAGCTAGVMRFYFKVDAQEDRRALLGSAITLQIGLNLIGTLFLVLFADPIWQHVLHGAQTKSLVYLAAANFTLGSVSTVPLILMQIEKRASLFAAVSVARLVMQLGGNIIFLVVLHWGPGGILLSSLIANILVGGVTATWMFRRVGFAMNRNALLDLRRFGLPYQLATLGTFIVTFGDRFFLGRYGGLAAVGLYGVAYQFGFLLEQLGIGPFVRAWTPHRFAYVRESPAHRDEKNQQGFLYLNVIAFTCATGIALFVHPVLRVLADREFWSSADFVPVILAAYIVQGWVSVTELGIDVSEKTKYVSYSVWASVAAVLFFYIVLIPRFGGAGAAWATLLGFLVRLFFHWKFSQRLCPLAYGWRPVLRLASYAVLVTLVSIYLRPASVFGELALATAWLGAFVFAVWTTILQQGDRDAVLGFVANRRHAVVRPVAIA